MSLQYGRYRYLLSTAIDLICFLLQMTYSFRFYTKR